MNKIFKVQNKYKKDLTFFIDKAGNHFYDNRDIELTIFDDADEYQSNDVGVSLKCDMLNHITRNLIINYPDAKPQVIKLVIFLMSKDIEDKPFEINKLKRKKDVQKYVKEKAPSIFEEFYKYMNWEMEDNK